MIAPKPEEDAGELQQPEIVLGLLVPADQDGAAFREPGQRVGVGPARGALLAEGPFRRPALRTGRARSRAPGSPRVPMSEGSPIGAAWSGSPVPAPPPRRGSATVRRCSPASSQPSSPSATHSLPSFTRWSAFPTADYSEGSVPARTRRPTAGLPEIGRSGPVPTFTTHRSTGWVPRYSPAASPRLPRSSSPWPPHGRNVRPPRSCPTRRSERARTADRPGSTRFGAGGSLEGVPPLVPAFVHLSVSLAGPRPSGSADPLRRCRGCSRPAWRLPGQAAPSLSRLLRQPEGEGLAPSHGYVAPRGAPAPPPSGEVCGASGWVGRPSRMRAMCG